MAAVAVQSIADDITGWISTNPGGGCVQRVPSPGALLRSSSKCNDIFVSYAAPAATDFARAVAARLRLERPHLRVAMDGIDRRHATSAAEARPGAAPLLPSVLPASHEAAEAVLVALTSEALQCPLVAREIAACLEGLGEAGRRRPRLAFLYHVRSGRGQDPSEMIRGHAPPWLRGCAERLGAGGAAVPIFEYLHEYEDLCVSAVLKWLGCTNVPSGMTLARLHSNVLTAARSLQLSEGGASASGAPPKADASPKTLPPIQRRSTLTALVPSVSGVKVTAKPSRAFAMGLLHDLSQSGESIARDVVDTCARAFGGAVRVAPVVGEEEEVVPCEHTANLLVIITAGSLRCDAVVKILARCLRDAKTNVLLLQDIRNVPNIWEEFGALPAALRPAVASIIAVPYLQSHGFSACLARIAGTSLLSPLEPSGRHFKKPAAAQYGRPSNAKLFDLFLCHFQRTGLDWAFVMRLNFVQHAGPSFRVFLDVQSLQHVSESGSYVEQSHAMAVLITPGIFTRFFCQRELLFTRKAGVQVIFIQHMRCCIDIEEELDRVRCPPAEFMARHGEDFTRAGGTEADFERFQRVLFEHLWTPRFRPPVFAYVQELEQQCVGEVTRYLRHRRARRSTGAEQLKDAAQAVLGFLRMSPEDREDVRAGLSVVANQASGGSGADICAAFVQSRAMPLLAEALQRHAGAGADGGVALQAFRALRSLAGTTSGEAALAQFAESEGAVRALHEALRAHAGAEGAAPLRREGLKVLRAFCSGGPALQHAVRRAGVWQDFSRMLAELRTELEPLDEIREMLNLAPVQLPQLEFALGSWHRAQGGGEVPPPAEVRQASALLKGVSDLREAVVAEDCARVQELLGSHLPGVERCSGSGIEALLLQAHALSRQFQEQQSLAEQRQRTLEEQERASRVAQERIEQLLADVAEQPAPEQLEQLEAAVVAAHQARCPEGFAERAREALEELRCAFDTPGRFLAEAARQWRHVRPSAVVQALLARSLGDRTIVIRCLSTASALAQDAAKPSAAVRRADVEGVLRALSSHPADLEVQAAACECLSEFLASTSLWHGVVSARALVEDASGDIAAIQAVINAIVTATQSGRNSAMACESACRCLGRLAGLGEPAVAEILKRQGIAKCWFALQQLGVGGREQHVGIVQEIVAVLEQVCRHSPRSRTACAVDTLLKVCDIYDGEGGVCTLGLQSLNVLFKEQQSWTADLVQRERHYTLEEDGSPKMGSQSCSMQVVLRNMRIHDRRAELQNVACQIVETTVGHVVECVQGSAIDEVLCCSLVGVVTAALSLHIGCAVTCTSAAAALARLVDLSADVVCDEIVHREGVEDLVRIMRLHRAVPRVQQCGLRTLSALAQRFPRQTLGETSIQALVSAMQSSPESAAMQRFGCAALRSVAELGSEVAAQVGQAGSEPVLAAMAAFPGDMPLHREALTVLRLAAASGPEHGRWLGEARGAVARVLRAAEALRPAVAQCQQAGGPCGGDAVLACLAACRALRDICGARALVGLSFERPFHRGVCQASGALAELLACSAAFHDLQLEVLQLLGEAALPDKDGALLVGLELARPRPPAEAGAPCASAVNVLVWVLQRFHTSDDCMVIFALIAGLAGCDDFAGSMSSEAALVELLRWTAIFRDDTAVQRRAMEAFMALLKTTPFDAGLLVSVEGLEAFLLAIARHPNDRSVVSPAEGALLAIAKSCSAQSLYAALRSTLQRQASNAAVVVAVCQALCSIFQAGVGVEDALFDSGTMLLLLSACQEHRRERRVAGVLMPLVDLSLRGAERRELLLRGGAAELLVDLVTRGLAPAEARKPAGTEDWLWEATLASRRARGRPEAAAEVSAGLRALLKLLCAEAGPCIATPELAALLARTAASSDDPALLEPAAALLAGVLRVVEEQVTWTACCALRPDREEAAASARRTAAGARAVLEAEARGLRQWRLGNFRPAAAEFRRAAAELRVLEASGGPALPREALAEHRRRAPLEDFARICEEHERIVLRETADARTTADVSPPEEPDDCAICLEALHGGGAQAKPLWTCETCHKQLHEACIVQWQQTNSSCPLCRRALEHTCVTASFHRARAIAEAADAYLQGQRRLEKASSLGNAFLAASVAALWRAALRVGHMLQLGATVLEQVEARAAQLEGSSARLCTEADEVVARFEADVVLPLEQSAAASAAPTRNADGAMRVLEAIAAEVLQRRCAFLAEEASMWLADAERMRQQSRLSHAEQLLVRTHAHLCEVVHLAPAAHLPTANAARQAERVAQLKQEVAALRARGPRDQSQGHVGALRPHWPGLTPFHACLQQASARPALAVHTVSAVRAIAAIGHAGRVGVGLSSWSGTFRRATETCGHLLDAMFHDRVPSRVVAFLSGVKGKPLALCAISFFQQLLHCGQERRESCFSHLDGIVAAVAAEGAQKDPELRACLHGLVHELVFEGGNEERMVRRLQREAAPRAAATLQEWFLDTLLVQHGVASSRDGILQAGQGADAWLLCCEGGHGGGPLALA